MKICPRLNCPSNGTPQPDDAFYRDAKRFDGLKGWCKRCHTASGVASKRQYSETAHGAAKVLQWRETRKLSGKAAAAKKKYLGSEKGILKSREYQTSAARKASDAKYRETHRADIHASQKAYAKTENGKAKRRQYTVANANKIAARTVVNMSVQCGHMPAPSAHPCTACGKPAQQYHHHLGYAWEHWLSVVPVCKKCHPSLEPKKPLQSPPTRSIHQY